MTFDTSNISIEEIPLPLAGILLSDPIHKAVLLSHEIDAGIVLFEHEPNQYYISSALGISLPLTEIEEMLLKFTQELPQADENDDFETHPVQIQIEHYHTLIDLAQKEGFNQIRIFQIYDYLNISGYWLIFFKNIREKNLSNTPLSHSLDSPDFIKSLQDTIKTQSETAPIEITTKSWIKVLDARDKETEEHSIRVANLTRELGKNYGIKNDQLDVLYYGALLHDIGKIIIPNEILHKPGPLTPEEWKIMKLHPSIARYLLSNFNIPDEILDIPFYHHEHWSGNGYPYGLAGEEIPLSARIFSVIDVWDALNSNRPYRAKLTSAQAKAYINENSNIQFDPKIVDCFLSTHQEN